MLSKKTIAPAHIDVKPFEAVKPQTLSTGKRPKLDLNRVWYLSDGEVKWSSAAARVTHVVACDKLLPFAPPS